MKKSAEDSSYLGNPKLRRSGTKHGWTKEQIEEFIKCSNDPIYFTEKYMKIVSLEEGEVPFKMYNYQKKIVRSVFKNRFSLVVASRQSGKSTTFCSFVLHYILFNQNKTIAILANKGETAREILSRVQFAYERLPKWMQHGVETFNKGSFELENGCRVLAAATSSSAIRGYSINCAIFDETAFIENWDEFYTSVFPTISSGKRTKIVLVSTPNGLNHFYKLYEDSISKKNDYISIMVKWFEVPGRDEKWAAQMQRQMSPEKFDQEFNCEFLGSSNSLIPSSFLKTVPLKDPINEDKALTGMRIYEDPIKGHRYAAACDISRGVGLDCTAVVMFDVSVVPYKQVAILQTPNLYPHEATEAIYSMGKHYNSAYLLIEINDIGQQIASMLFMDYEYENLFSGIPQGRSGVQLALKPHNGTHGIRTTENVKRIGCASLRNHLINHKMLISDQRIVEELSMFTKQGATYKAEAGYTDDLVMSLVLFAWMIDQSLFAGDFAGAQIDHSEAIKQVEDALLPLGFRSQDLDDYDEVWMPADHNGGDTGWF